ncbi:hypothetical protein R3W88_016412 [Solanum pinnatisectum]|uniref:START domain-containing protein n=1 Tax=Solanum pinnatisectum TaxID=50273 RepID=A0AAV9KXI5_9SOLN|nr:hypothetical protein R3W88_016412 [Solanum pinnatisectum]
MQDHTDTTERRESLVNPMIRGPREDQNEDNFVTNNRDGGASADELNSPHGISPKRHKYSVNQIQELEVVYKENSHPDEKTRLELTTKFFVGKKTTAILKEILNEHARLKNELTRIVIHADKFLWPSTFLEGLLTSMMEYFVLELLTGREETSDINVVDDLSLNKVDFGKYLSSPLPTNLVNKDLTLDKSMLLNLALDALNELLKLAMSDEPFWVRSLNGGGETLNIEEYARSFIPIIGINPSNFTTEATRSFGTAACNSLTLVEMLMNKSQWEEMFPCIIGKVDTFDVISTGIGETKSGTLLLLETINLHIETELQIISNVVPACEIQFLCFCQKHVIWIEHMEYDEIFVHHLYRPLIRACLGFGAQRWMSSLQRLSVFLRVMTSFVDSTTIQLPIKLQCLFEFFTNKNMRSQWDILSYSGPMKNIIHITKGKILRVASLCYHVQDTCTDAISSLLVYAIVDSSKMNTVMKGGDSSSVEILPNGILIVPDLSQDYSANNYNGENDNEFCMGNLSTTDLPEKSIIDANDIISHTIHKIKTALKCK